MMKKKKFISACLMLSLLAVAGCGDTETGGQEVIELKEPAAGESGWLTETVIRRNIYVAELYEAAVYPEVQEYSYEVRQTFDTYGNMLGDKVEVGETLIQGDTESVDKQIESLEERLATLKEDFEEYQAEANEVIADKTWYVGYYQKIFDNLENQEPEEYITDKDGAQITNPEYTKWKKEWNKWLGTSNKNDLDLQVAQEELRQKKEIYELDYAYYNDQLKELKVKRSDAALKSEIVGEVVGIGMYYPGQAMQADATVVAVGDMNKVSVVCEYIPRRNIVYYAKEVYVFINGTRYEVIYDDNGNPDCTTFYLTDENADVEVGDYAVVVLETNSREQVIAVKKEAIYVDSGGHYVYVEENGTTVQKPVKIGVSDGIYTEIVSGLSEGEEVLVSEKVEPLNTHQLGYGTFAKSSTRSGELYYPINFYQEHGVEYGTVFFQEYLVEQFQYVEAGQPIARIRVEGDMVELARLENELQRAKERLADVLAQVAEENAESYAERIESQQEAIAEQEEELNKLKTDYATVEIYAERSGIVTSLGNYTREQVIGSNYSMIWMADAEYAYLALEGMAELKYGDVLDITYKNAAKQDVESEATVVSMGTPGVSAVLDEGVRYAKLPESVMNDMVEVLRAQTGRFSASNIKATASLNTIENVLLIPKVAVKEKEGITYVNVIQEDGSVVPVSFLAGGSDIKNYWVIEGLTEGMTICWE